MPLFNPPGKSTDAERVFNVPIDFIGGTDLLNYVQGSHAAITHSRNGMYCGSSASAPNRACVYIQNYAAKWEQISGFQFFADAVSVNHATQPEAIAFIGCGLPGSNNAGADIDQSKKHIGFFYEVDGTDMTLHASISDGTTQTKRLIRTELQNTTPSWPKHTYSMKKKDGVWEIYEDGVLQDTISDNLPTGTMDSLFSFQEDKTVGSSTRNVQYTLARPIITMDQ